jgi:hypothetical protein
MVDRLIERYRDGRCVVGYKNPYLYVSYPDSDITLVMDERFTNRYGDPVWVGPFDFGMTCFYTRPDTNIFWFGHSNYPGYVFTYPNGTYSDVAPESSVTVAVAYESGWQSYGGYTFPKKLLSSYFPVTSAGYFAASIFPDFDTAAADTFSSIDTGAVVHRIDNLAASGEYFKVRLSGNSGEAIRFRPYTITWQESEQWQGH